MNRGEYIRMPRGYKIYCEDDGDGTPIVFLHGWNSTHEVFRETISGLQKCRCIAYDCCGHGKSEAPVNGITLDSLADDLHEIITFFKLDNVVLVGWSMGAATIWRYIHRYGCDRLAHLVLIDMSPKVLNDSEWKLGLWQGNYFFQDYLNDMTVEFTDFSKFATSSMWKKYDLKTGVPEPDTMKNDNYHVLTALWHSMMVTDCRDDLKEIEVAVDIFFGEPGDKYLPQTAVYLSENIPSKTNLVPFYGCGHGLIWQDAPKFLLELQRVIKSIRGRET